jgi:hypothetical protein
MIKSTEHRKSLERELTRVGITPQVETTGSGHVRLSWTIAGVRQSIICSSSPSDWRSNLNSRARVRRLLRSAGVTLDTPPPRRQATLAFQSSEASPEPEPLEPRLERLEMDVGALLDMLVDAIMTQATRKDQRPTTAGIVTEKKQRAWVLRYLAFDSWTHRSDVQARSGRTQGAVDMGLSNAKSTGSQRTRRVCGARLHGRCNVCQGRLF